MKSEMKQKGWGSPL